MVRSACNLSKESDSAEFPHISFIKMRWLDGVKNQLAEFSFLDTDWLKFYSNWSDIYHWLILSKIYSQSACDMSSCIKRRLAYICQIGWSIPFRKKKKQNNRRKRKRKKVVCMFDCQDTIISLHTKWLIGAIGEKTQGLDSLIYWIQYLLRFIKKKKIEIARKGTFDMDEKNQWLWSRMWVGIHGVMLLVWHLPFPLFTIHAIFTGNPSTFITCMLLMFLVTRHK